MIAPADLDALEAVANALGFTMYRRARFLDIGIDYDHVQLASKDGMKCRLGSDPKMHPIEMEFEGTPRECAAFLTGWRDAHTERGLCTCGEDKDIGSHKEWCPLG